MVAQVKLVTQRAGTKEATIWESEGLGGTASKKELKKVVVLSITPTLRILQKRKTQRSQISGQQKNIIKIF